MTHDDDDDNGDKCTNISPKQQKTRVSSPRSITNEIILNNHKTLIIITIHDKTIMINHYKPFLMDNNGE